MGRDRLHQRFDVRPADGSDGAAGTRLGRRATAPRNSGSRRGTRSTASSRYGSARSICETVLARCAKGGVPASLIFSIADIFEDPQYRARGNIQMTDSRIGEIAVPGVVPRLSATPGEISWLGEGLGEQNQAVFEGLLELDGQQIETLREQGVI